MFIDMAMLNRLHACQPQRSLFMQTFPNGVEVTEELCIKYAHHFDLTWFANNHFHGNAMVYWSKGEDNVWSHRLDELADLEQMMDPGFNRDKFRAAAHEIRREYQLEVAKLFAEAAAIMDKAWCFTWTDHYGNFGECHVDAPDSKTASEMFWQHWQDVRFDDPCTVTYIHRGL